jgi:putative membrane protein
MSTELLLRYVHFVSIFTIVATLAGEHLLLKPELTRKEIARLAVIDGIYGAAAVILLTAGLMLWLGSYGKPAVVYSKNWIFHFKIALVITMGLLSIYPTVFYLKNRKGDEQQRVPIPKSVVWMVRLELLLLLIIPLLAGLMARGVGYYG